MGAFTNGFLFSQEPNWEALSNLPLAVKVYKHRHKDFWFGCFYKHHVGVVADEPFTLDIPLDIVSRTNFIENFPDAIRAELKLLETISRLTSNSGFLVDNIMAMRFAYHVACHARVPTYYYASNDETLDIGCLVDTERYLEYGILCPEYTIVRRENALRVISNYQENDTNSARSPCLNEKVRSKLTAMPGVIPSSLKEAGLRGYGGFYQLTLKFCPPELKPVAKALGLGTWDLYEELDKYFALVATRDSNQAQPLYITGIDIGASKRWSTRTFKIPQGRCSLEDKGKGIAVDYSHSFYNKQGTTIGEELLLFNLESWPPEITATRYPPDTNLRIFDLHPSGTLLLNSLVDLGDKFRNYQPTCLQVASSLSDEVKETLVYSSPERFRFASFLNGRVISQREQPVLRKLDLGGGDYGIQVGIDDPFPYLQIGNSLSPLKFPSNTPKLRLFDKIYPRVIRIDTNRELLAWGENLYELFGDCLQWRILLPREFEYPNQSPYENVIWGVNKHEKLCYAPFDGQWLQHLPEHEVIRLTGFGPQMSLILLLKFSGRKTQLAFYFPDSLELILIPEAALGNEKIDNIGFLYYSEKLQTLITQSEKYFHSVPVSEIYKEKRLKCKAPTAIDSPVERRKYSLFQSAQADYLPYEMPGAEFVSNQWFEQLFLDVGFHYLGTTCVDDDSNRILRFYARNSTLYILQARMSYTKKFEYLWADAITMLDNGDYVASCAHDFWQEQYSIPPRLFRYSKRCPDFESALEFHEMNIARHGIPNASPISDLKTCLKIYDRNLCAEYRYLRS
jgi:hypothetical protein